MEARHSYIEHYVRHWSRLDWSPAALADAHVPETLTNLVGAIALAESHSFEEARKITLAGLHRHKDIREFLPRWLAEEQEHARALAFVATVAGSVPSVSIGVRDRLRSAMSSLVLLAARKLPGLDLAFFCLGAAAEYLTRELYGHLSRNSADDELAKLFKELSKQEARHQAFYVAGAKARGSQSRLSLLVARLILKLFWRPVGIDTLGAATWHQTVGCLLRDYDFLNRARAMDRFMDRLPAMDGLNLMGKFLSRTGYVSSGAEHQIQESQP